MEEEFEHLLYLVSDEMRSKISPRIRFMIEDVIEMVMPTNILNKVDSNTELEYSST